MKDVNGPGNVRVAELKSFMHSIRPFKTNIDMIRIGCHGDGGYLVPDDLAGIQSCFSAGVGNSAAFEAHLATFGIPSYMADYSVERPPLENKLFHFEKKYIGTIDNAQYMTMDSWVKKYSPKLNNNLLLQMDIEGAEYEVIQDCSQSTLQLFRIIVIEFHNLAILTSAAGFYIVRSVFNKILTNFEVVHIHSNNYSDTISFKACEIPLTMETFFRKDRISVKKPVKKFPHPLDTPNSAHYNDIALPKCWYE